MMSAVRVKKEVVECEEKDMTHYIKDRVELMRQVFSVLRERELLAMAPASLRSLPVDHLQELCLDEVLGISSKRLCSILDGYECPSDTDSECNDTTNMETLSLDSISSLEEDLQHAKHKKKDRHHKKHKRRTGSNSKTVAAPSSKAGSSSTEATTSKRKKSNTAAGGEDAGTAGMTVLELLELQMRAKAIRAQLQSVQASASDDEERRAEEGNEVEIKHDDDDDDIEIKEEKPEVVELITSSDEDTVIKEEKPSTPKVAENSAETTSSKLQPTGGPPRKIKLNRNNKLLISVGGEAGENTTLPSNDLRNLLQRKKTEASVGGRGSGRQYRERTSSQEDTQQTQVESVDTNTTNSEEKKKTRKKKKHKASGGRKSRDKGKECDEDEILLELSDTEKMFDSEEEDSTGVSVDSDGSASCQEEQAETDVVVREGEVAAVSEKEGDTAGGGGVDTDVVRDAGEGETQEETENNVTPVDRGGEEDNNTGGDVLATAEESEILKSETTEKIEEEGGDKKVEEESRKGEEGETSKNRKHKKKGTHKKKLQNNTGDLEKSQAEEVEEQLSEGECSESSDDVEIMEGGGQEETVVCISDGEGGGVLGGGDEEEGGNIEECDKDEEGDAENVAETAEGSEEEEDLILEISDDSSRDSDLCILSKEPSREEILQLSRKLEREMDIAVEQEGEDRDVGGADGDHTWKKRWLDSDKVRSVLKTSSLFNAVRRKNMELRRMLREGGGAGSVGDEEGSARNNDSNVVETTVENENINTNASEADDNVDVSSVEFYKSLPSGSKEYSNPKKDVGQGNNESETKKMAKDAKQLMKMYRKLLKINREAGEKEGKNKREGKTKKKKKNKEKKKKVV